MKLWILRPIDSEEGFWDPWYDKAFWFVVRAKTEEEARAAAQAEGGDEVFGDWASGGRVTRPAWASANHSTCEELSSDGDVGIIIKDFHAA